MLTKQSTLQQTLLSQFHCNIYLSYYKGLYIAPHHLNDCGEYITMKTKSIHRTRTPGHLGFHALCSSFWNRATDINYYISYNTRETLIIRQS